MAEIEFHQQVDPINPSHWFLLGLRCPECRTEALISHVTGKEAKRWINLFRIFHEQASCGWDPHQ